MSDVWDILGRKHAAKVLRYVYEHPGTNQKSIIDTPDGGRAAKLDRLKELTEMGYIYTKKSQKDWSSLEYYTTELGSEKARGVIHIEDGAVVDEMNCGSPSEEGNTIRE